MNETFPQIGHFSWQEGYGGFTVSKSVVPEVEAYIVRQKEHHQCQDFKSEFLELLRSATRGLKPLATSVRPPGENRFAPSWNEHDCT
jgi:hypothetical protein